MGVLPGFCFFVSFHTRLSTRILIQLTGRCNGEIEKTQCVIYRYSSVQNKENSAGKLVVDFRKKSAIIKIVRYHFFLNTQLINANLTFSPA